MRDRKFRARGWPRRRRPAASPGQQSAVHVYNPNNSDDAKLTNYQGWRTSFYDEKLNKMIEAALVERDVAKQTKMYEDIQVYMDEIVPSIQPFSEVEDTAAYRATCRV